MKVRILSNINSGQFVAGQVVEFTDAEAEALIQAGAAEAYSEAAPQETTPQPDGFPVHDTTPAPAPEAPQAPAAPEAPAEAAPLEQPAPEQPSSAAPQAPSEAASDSKPADKQPTPEDIAATIANIQ